MGYFAMGFIVGGIAGYAFRGKIGGELKRLEEKLMAEFAAIKAKL